MKKMQLHWCSGFVIQDQLNARPLSIKIDDKLKFYKHVKELCSEASQKLYALARIRNYVNLNQSRIRMNTFFFSHFGYFPLVWMINSRTLNNRINRFHEQAFYLVYKENLFSFDELLKIDNSFTIHECNIQSLTIELYKVDNRISPKFMSFR